MALVEPLHGLTFALLHLACMQMLSVVVPPALAATAQGIYGGVAVGTMTAVMTLAWGPLYGALGPRAFWVMALLCAAALPIAFTMRRISINASGLKSGSTGALGRHEMPLKHILNGGFDRSCWALPSRGRRLSSQTSKERRRPPHSLSRWPRGNPTSIPRYARSCSEPMDGDCR